MGRQQAAELRRHGVEMLCSPTEHFPESIVRPASAILAPGVDGMVH